MLSRACVYSSHRSPARDIWVSQETHTRMRHYKTDEKRRDTDETSVRYFYGIDARRRDDADDVDQMSEQPTSD